MSGFFAGFNIPLTGSGPNIGITSAQGINGAQQIVGFYQIASRTYTASC
jgi:hypothetical protein